MINNGVADVTLIGNLVAPVELTMAGETPKGKIRLAVNESWMKDGEKQEHVSFFAVTVWGKRASACEQYLVKGQQIVVQGRLRQERFEDKDSGDPVSYIHIVAREVIFGDKPKSAGGEAPVDTEEETPF